MSKTISWGPRKCPRSRGTTKLEDGGSLIIGKNPRYIPPQLPPGYCGHFPKIQYLDGITAGDSLKEHYIDERENTFTNGYSRRPKLRLSGRPIATLVSEYPSYHVAHFKPSKTEYFMNLHEAIQNHRNKYQDLTGKKMQEPYFIIANKVEDLYRDLKPINSYYLHKNRRPLPGMPDSSWSYVHRMSDVYHHKCRDNMGIISKCYKTQYHRRTKDPDIQPVLHGYR